MAFFSITMLSGTVAQHHDLKHRFDGRDAGGDAHVFYAERNYDIETMRTNVNLMAGNAISVEVAEISRKEFDWRKCLSKR